MGLNTPEDNQDEGQCSAQHGSFTAAASASCHLVSRGPVRMQSHMVNNALSHRFDMFLMLVLVKS